MLLQQIKVWVLGHILEQVDNNRWRRWEDDGDKQRWVDSIEGSCLDVYQYFCQQVQKQLLLWPIKEKSDLIQYIEAHQYRQLDHLLLNSWQALQSDINSQLDLLLKEGKGEVKAR